MFSLCMRNLVHIFTTIGIKCFASKTKIVSIWLVFVVCCAARKRGIYVNMIRISFDHIHIKFFSCLCLLNFDIVVIIHQ